MFLFIKLHDFLENMRIRVEIGLKKSNALLPFDHQYYLASFIYRALEKIDSSYALELHQPKRYKFFTFSYLMSRERKATERGILIRGSEIYFFVSSPSGKFVKTLVEALIANPGVKIAGIEGVIKEIKILETPKFERTAKFRTLSPILVRKPVRENGRLRGKELYPTDEEFERRLILNLARKYYHFYGKEKENSELSVKFLRFKPKRHRIINTYHRCVLGEFIVSGDKELTKFAYECGFGEKNSMGFGMVKLVK